MKKLICFVTVCAGLSSVVRAADIALLDDFGRPEIQDQQLNLGSPVGSTIAGIHQEGNLNSAMIDQSGGSGNVAQVWQIGDQSRAAVIQIGSGNELHLLQSGDLIQADLTQTGTGNQIAIQMLGSFSSVQGAQSGNDNRVVSVISDNANLNFSQTGDAHLLQIDVGSGMSVTVVQP